MNQAQWLPFERNRYYLGKMLTSADFEAEQLYMNHKHSFINRMMFGTGIICGLGVFNLDDLSILIESGAAIDEFGREIVIENSIVKKVSAISGFEHLKSDRISLCLRYKEEAVHPVYAVSKQEKGEEFENNRILEGYELFLTDTGLLENSFEMESEFLQKAVLFEDEDYFVELQMPAVVSKNTEVRISIVVTKKSDCKAALSLEGILQLPAFTAENKSRELNIGTKQIVLEKGKRKSFDFWVLSDASDASDTDICIKAGTGKAMVGKVLSKMDEKFSMKVILTDLSPIELVKEQLGKLSLEMRNMGSHQDFVRLADFDMERTGSAYIIGRIHERGVKSYLTYPAQEQERNTYLSYFRSPVLNENRGVEKNKVTIPEPVYQPSMKPIISSGTLEIPLDVDMKKGAVCFSEEVPHGLGKGNVYVEVGIEYLEEDVGMQENIKSTVYGDPSLFAEQNPFAIWIQTAVKVFNDKGSFQVAAKLLGEQRTVLLVLNWIAVKAPGGTEETALLTANNKKSIIPVSPTVSLLEKEKHYFDVKFNQMEPCRLVYEMTEPQSGEISPEGVYTAPSRPGVYEIHIYCADNPGIFTYAYAVVHKKRADR